MVISFRTAKKPIDQAATFQIAQPGMRFIADDNGMTVFFPSLLQNGNRSVPVIPRIGACQFNLVREKTCVAQRTHRVA